MSPAEEEIPRGFKRQVSPREIPEKKIFVKFLFLRLIGNNSAIRFNNPRIIATYFPDKFHAI